MNAIKKVFSDKEHEGTTGEHTQSRTAADTANSTRVPTTAGGRTGDGISEIPRSTGDIDTPPRHTGDIATGREEVARRDLEPTDRGITNEFDPQSATHSHTHLAEKTHERQHHHEIEEVERLRHQERHVQHIQHHVQPIKDEAHLETVHHQRAIPQTHIEERHASTDADRRAYAGRATAQDTITQGQRERTVVDLGEKVNTTTHHHVHNVIQPVIERDVHEHHKINTTIPVHHVEHLKPVVHQSVEHGIISKDDYLRQGGVLGSNISHENADVLATGKDERVVDGVGEELARKLHLGATTGPGVNTTSNTAI